MVRVRLLNALKAILSVPKKSCRVCTMAPLMQPCPDGCSGKPGVTSGVPNCGVAGSNNGVHAGSASVAGLPSVSASRIAVIGRQNFQWYLLSQQPIAPSAEAKLALANRRAVSAMPSPRLAESARKTRFHSAGPWSCQKIAASV